MRYLCTLGTLLLGGSLAVAQTESIYQDSLASGWQDWSWSSNIDLANASPVYGGSGTSVSIEYLQQWAGFYLHTVNLVDAATHVKLRFKIHGGSSGGQHLRILPFDQSLEQGAGVTVPIPVANTWSSVEISTSSFNISQISGMAWQDTSGLVEPGYYLDEIEWVLGTPPQPGVGPALTVDAGQVLGRINPDIYGMSFTDAALATELSLPVRRFGGNATTRYNWQLDTINQGEDWYFENTPIPNDIPEALPTGSLVDFFVIQDQSTGTASLITMPLIGWTPKERAEACGFSVTKYGPQQSTDPQRPDCGNGIRPDGSFITGNDPTDTSVAVGPSFVQAWIAHLISLFGTAAQGGVKYYELDNEPTLWNSTHRDVHPEPLSYDELRDRTYQYASAIKAADPGAKTFGPVAWGWTAYFYSALDIAPGGTWWLNPQDRNAHGGQPLIEWYLDQMRIYEETNEVRILDYLDVHSYPQSGVSLTTAGDALLQAKRLRSTRCLWDPSYGDESWIGEPIYLISRMHAWVDQHYPGTKLAITEYNYGGLEHINGALAQADVLGIFGREGLDLATLWDLPGETLPGAFAFRIYRNYDGNGGMFGDRRVAAESADQGLVSIYAARTDDNRLTVVVINKQTEQTTCDLTLTGIWPSGPAEVYRYSEANLSEIVHDTDHALPGGPVQLTLPASSMALLIVSGQLASADLDGDGDVDADDLALLTACRSRAEVAVDAGCSIADLDADGDSDSDDFGLFQRCYAGIDVAVNPDCGG